MRFPVKPGMTLWLERPSSWPTTIGHLFSPLKWSNAGVLLEEAGEIAAVGEADAAGNGGKGSAGFGEHLLHGVLEAELRAPGAEVFAIGLKIPI